MVYRKFSQRLIFVPLILSIMVLITFLIANMNNFESHREKFRTTLGWLQNNTNILLVKSSTDKFSSSTKASPTSSAPFIDSFEIVGQRESDQFTPFVASTFEVLSKHHYYAFIIEPCVLWSFLTVKQRNLLQSRKSAAEHALNCTLVTNSNLTMFTIGVYAWDVGKIQQTVIDDLKGISEEVSEVKEINSGETSHIFLKEGKGIVHIVNFFARNNFFFVFEASIPPMNLKNEDLRFGQYDMAFEPIGLSYYSIKSKNVLLPTDIERVLFELPHSRFLECRHDRAQLYKDKYPQTPESLAQLHSTIKVMRYITYSLRMPIWMDGGSLMGWARHCSAIPYERDADFASWGSILEDKYELAEQIVKSVKTPWYFIESFGLPWMGFELRLYNIQLDWQVDLFFTTQDEQNSTRSYLGYHNDPGVSFVKLYYANKIFEKVCAGEVLGFKIHVPCNYDMLLTEEYGKEWITPDERHFLKYQPGQHHTYWTEKEGLHAYQCLGRNHFSLRRFNHSEFSYTPEREMKKLDVNENFREAIGLYKSACTRLRWNRTN